MIDHRKTYASKLLRDDAVLGLVRDGDFIYVNGGPGLPNRFMQMLVANATRFRDLRLGSPMRRETLPLHPDPTAPELEGHIFCVSDFTYEVPSREAVRDGRAAFRPNHPTDAGRHFPYDIDIVVAAASPMDKHGFFSLGAFGGWIVDFLHRAKKVVLEVNPHQPRLRGPNIVHVDDIAGVIEAGYSLVTIQQQAPSTGPSAEETALAEHVASVIKDGATIQVGAGQMPDVVINRLIESGRRDLGIHTEAVFDWLVPLYEAGLITNSKKTLHKGKVICSCAAGSEALYAFLDDNPVVEMHPISYTNDPRIIAKNFRQVSINATIQVDLFGQCASETIGPLHYSGTGGQWNFHYGAALAEEGCGIMTMLSTAKNGTVSRVVPMLPTGSVVSIPRNDLHYIATEHGIVKVKGYTMEERARRLISIAHPRFREQLEKAARDELRLFARRVFPGASTRPAAE